MTISPPQPRPLSPHLGIYKRQISSVLSILHRATGIGLALGLPFFAVWLLILGSSSDVYEFFTGNIKSIVGQTILVILFFLILSYIFSFLNTLIRDIRPSSGPLKWTLVLMDLVAAAIVTRLLREHFATADPDLLDKICAPIGLIALIGWTWAFFYHFCCGIRHLMWDAGWFLSIRGMHVTGWITILLSALMTLCVWLEIYGLLSFSSLVTGITS